MTTEQRLAALNWLNNVPEALMDSVAYKTIYNALGFPNKEAEQKQEVCAACKLGEDHTECLQKQEVTCKCGNVGREYCAVIDDTAEKCQSTARKQEATNMGDAAAREDAVMLDGCEPEGSPSPTMIAALNFYARQARCMGCGFSPETAQAALSTDQTNGEDVREAVDVLCDQSYADGARAGWNEAISAYKAVSPSPAIINYEKVGGDLEMFEKRRPSTDKIKRAHEIIRAATANTQQKSEWQDISTAPRDGTDFIAYANNSSSGIGKCFIGHWESDGFYFAEGGELDAWNWTVNKWKPLDAPKTTGKDSK